MNTQEKFDIFHFKKGDVITRLEPIKGTNGVPSDYGLVGKKTTFLGIANASIYLSQDTDFLTALMTGSPNFSFQIPLEIAKDGWAFHIDPDFLDSSDPASESLSQLEKQLEAAVLSDRYEDAAQIREKIKQIGKSLKKDIKKDENGQD